MERQKKIVDASVIVKIFAEEEDSDKASRLLEDAIEGKIILTAPEFIFLEILNALRYKKFDQERLKESTKFLFELPIEKILLNEELLIKTIEFSAIYDLSIYDAVYAALAQTNNVELITIDNKLLKIPNAVHLSKLNIN